MMVAAGEAIRVLLVDDDAEDAVLTQRLLHSASASGYKVDWRDGFDSGLEALAITEYDVMLLDFRLSGENGLDLLRSARARGTRSPAILLTGEIDRELDLKAMQAGVVDFLEKNSLNAATLERSIRYASERGRFDRERLLLLDAERRARSEAEAAQEHTAVVATQLRQAQKLEAVGQLAGGIAHDFNNLLTVISGHSEFLAETFDETDPRAEDVEAILLAGRRAANLTHQLLAFSRQQILQPRVVDIDAVVAGIEPMLRRLIGEDIAFVVRPSDDCPTVLADPGQLEQVLMNLVINGRDAMPGGGTLTVEVQLVHLDRAYPVDHAGVVPGRYAMLAVSDTGVGMSEEVRDKIFDPFFTTKAAGKGTGLGLSTAYGIVKQSNGYIWAYSEPGLGSTFKVYFPLTEQEVSPCEENEVQTIAGGSETILLVEDEEAVRGVSRRILAGQGYQVLEARDGIHALEVAAAFAGDIHLLVTDVVMPRMNGRALADQLKPHRPGMSVLYLSGYTNDEILRRTPVGADVRLRWLQKPFTTIGLTAAVRAALAEPVELVP